MRNSLLIRLICLVVGIVMLAVFLRANLSEKKPDTRDVKIAALEKRLSEMESLQRDIAKADSDMLNLIKDFESNTAYAFTNVAGELLLNSIRTEFLSEQLTNYITSLSNTVARRAGTGFTTQTPIYRTPIYQAPQTTISGVPTETYVQIISDATAKWPGNFDMQEYEIKKQVEAYRRLHP